MQSQSIENIFANEDVMQGGTVWNAVPDYMFTKGCKSYESLSSIFHNVYLSQIYVHFLIDTLESGKFDKKNKRSLLKCSKVEVFFSL